MKRIILMLIVLISVTFAQAQNYAILHVEEVSATPPNVFNYCNNEYSGVVIYAQEGCYYNEWTVDFTNHYQNLESITIEASEEETYVHYSGCGLNRIMTINFLSSEIDNPFSEPVVWKRQGESVMLETDYQGWWLHWSTGETTQSIEVYEPGIYTVNITDSLCVDQTFSIEVRDNVELYRSGVDPATNKNRVLWQTTPTQAEYISNVKVERDGMVVGTVPYTDGQFLDNIGSENAARIYRITGIASDGTECPLPSYQFGTFNTIISPDIANPSLMNFTWEDPFVEEGSPYSIVAYRIGRFNEATGEFIAIDQVSAQVHIAKYNMDLFDGDYGLVAAVFSDAKNRDYEELAFSNRSDSGIVGINEQNGETFEIYPNPAKDRFTVEGSGTMTVMNTLGQTVMTKEIDGKTTIELSQGLYFVKLGGAMRKVVVE